MRQRQQIPGFPDFVNVNCVGNQPGRHNKVRASFLEFPAGQVAVCAVAVSQPVEWIQAQGLGVGLNRFPHQILLH